MAHGPKGCGFLYIRKGVEIDPLISGGSQEANQRAGTENLVSIVGMGEAARIAALNIGKMGHIAELRDKLENEILNVFTGVKIGLGISVIFIVLLIVGAIKKRSVKNDRD